MTMIRCRGVEKAYGETRALDGVDLDVPEATVLGLLGPNGAGKTTIVRILATLLKPDAGSVNVGGYDLADQAHAIRGLIGLTGQYAAVDGKLTGFENLLMIARLLGMSRRDARQRSLELLNEFDLAAARNRAVQGYSGGMRRRLDLAASLIGRPKVLFLDEPTTGLDPRARIGLWELVRRMVADGVTVLLTTQYLEEADALADDVAVLDHGRIIARGSPERLKQQVGHQVLKVQPENKHELGKARELLSMDGRHRVEQSGQYLSVAVNKAEDIPPLMRRLDEAGIQVGDISLRGASLDDVFLQLTGRPAEVTDQATQDQEVEPQEGEKP